MAARHWLTLTLALCGAVAVTGAEAAARRRRKPSPKDRPRSRAAAPTFKAPYCVGVATSKGTYSLWDAKPWIPPGTAVEVWGKAMGPGMCGGTAIQVTSWRASKSIKCKA